MCHLKIKLSVNEALCPTHPTSEGIYINKVHLYSVDCTTRLVMCLA